MEAELLQLAREAVAALQSQAAATSSTRWVEVLGLGIGFGQIGLIAWGLRQMGRASEERNRQLDQQGEALRDIGQALRDQGQVLAELLRRTA